MKTFPCLLVSLICFSHTYAQPVIGSFDPVSGPVGTMVTIKGRGFAAGGATNIVRFGPVKAAILTATDTLLQVSVPAGSTYQPVSVTANHLVAYAVLTFTVTFSGDAGPFSDNAFLPKMDMDAGIYPHDVCLADFNDDGKSDLLVSRGSSNEVSVFANASEPGSIAFAPKLDFPASGRNHEGAATGDLDGDGKTDFVLLNSLGGSFVSIYRNTSASAVISFASAIDYTAADGPYTVALGDIDGDGKPDLAVANNGSNVISIFRNKSVPGTITFDERIDFAAGTNPYSIAVRDLDGDGKPDLAVTTQNTTSALSVMRNTSTADVISFDPGVTCASLAGSFVVSVGDLDGDGKPDLAAASSGADAVVVVRNTSAPGNMSFEAQQSFAAGDYPVFVSIADLNGDGLADLVTANRQSNTVSALKNTGSAGSISFAPPVDYTVDLYPIAVAIGDLDGNGKPDIMVANSSSRLVSILGNIMGAGIAPEISAFSPVSGISGTTVKIKGRNFTAASMVTFGGVAAASFVVDSATGITAMVGPGASGDVRVTTANGTARLGGFQFNGPIISSFTPATGVEGTTVTIIGLNFMGVTGVSFGGTPAASFAVNAPTSIKATLGKGSTGSITVATANGQAHAAGFSFGVPTITAITPASGPAGSSATITGTNFDPDASRNIVFFGAVKAIVSAASPVALTVTVPAGATYLPVSVTRNNLTAYSSDAFLVTFPNDDPLLRAGSFSVVASYRTGTYPSAVTISDLNDDGKPDLVTANSVGNSITVLKNISQVGKVSFGTGTDYVTGPDPKQIAVGDLDGDGKPDLAISSFNSGSESLFSVFRNSSTGGSISFAPKADYATGNGSIGIAMADLDGDGRPDCIVSSGNSGILSIFKNTTVKPGSITFSPKQDITFLGHGDNIVVIDADEDGKADIAVSNFSDGTISVLKNTSTGGNIFFAGKMDYATGQHPGFITAGDLNQDGKMDLVVQNYSSGSVSFYSNTSGPGYISFGARQDYVLKSTNISVADLNGDGKPDLCAGMGLSGTVSVIENTGEGAGNFSFAEKTEYTTGNYDTYVGVGDLDGDGKPEIVASNTIPNTVSILRTSINDPAIAAVTHTEGSEGATITLTGKNFTETISVEFGGSPARSYQVVSPQRIDAVVGGGASGNITVTTPLGTGTFTGFKFMPAIEVAGTVTFCDGGSVTLRSTADANNQWYKDGTLIAGANGVSFVATASGTYTLKTTANGITTSPGTGVMVNVTTVPVPVVMKDANNYLVSSAATGNQWFLDEAPIPGASGATYAPTQNGSYTVRDTMQGCVSDFSAPYYFNITGIIELDNGQYISLYPNPVRNKLTIQYKLNSTAVLQVEVTDLHGRRMLLQNNVRNNTAVGLEKLPAGLYFVKVYSSEAKINSTIKIIKE